METILYCEINFLLLIVLFIILYEEKKEISRRAKRLDFEWLVLSTIIILFEDIAWKLIESYSNLRILNMIINVLYLSQIGVINYWSLRYINDTLGIEIKKKINKVLSILPLLLLFFCCFLTPWTGWLFTITPANEYMRGPLYLLQPIISWSYLAYIYFQLIRRIIKDKSTHQQKNNLLLFAFSVPPIVGSICQVAFKGVPLTFSLVSLSLLLVYIKRQNTQISIDDLTGLNNRGKFDIYLAHAINNIANGNELYLILGDINHFKKINDSYGHQEGDKALQIFAHALRISCDKLPVFIARYGGDEFVIIYQSKDSNNIYKLINDISNNLSSEIKNKHLLYPMTVSFGIAKYNKETMSSSGQFIAAADKEMYLHKVEDHI